MIFKFLGTAAAEGIPAVFCECEACTIARKRGGKHIRTRSQAMINDDFLIDLNADTYTHFLNNNIVGSKIKNCIVTHNHSYLNNALTYALEDLLVEPKLPKPLDVKLNLQAL